jgi:Reverse transcriptase (RNA-dependent DNA polymerase)
LRWIKHLVLQGKSQTVLNGVAERHIILKRGVRQRDPLSPYLFNLVIDFLARWIIKLNDINLLQASFPGCKTCLLYVDDTLIFIKPTLTHVRLLDVILHKFWEMSGLGVNYQKSELLLTVPDTYSQLQFAQSLSYRVGEFPITYLGLPLSNKKISKYAYQPMLDSIQARLPGWKGDKLSIWGR